MSGAALSSPSDFKKILVIRRGKIGDTIMASGALKLLRSIYPSAYIAVLTSPLCRPLIDDPDIVDLVIDDAPPTGKLSYSIYKTMQALRLRSLRFDVCFLMGESRSNAKRLQRWANIPVRVCASQGERYRGLADHCTHVVRREDTPARHEVDFFQDIVRSVTGSQESAAPFMAQLPRTDLPALARAAAAPGKKIALCIQGSKYNLHRWPYESILSCLKTLGGKGYSLFALVSHGEEGRQVTELAREAAVSIDVIPGSLAESARLLRAMDLLLSIDSGQVHMAAALGVPVLSLAGPTVLETYPYTLRGLALATTPGCRYECPFLNSCPTNKKVGDKPADGFCPPCMRALPPAIVCEYVERILENPEQPEPYHILIPPEMG